MEMTAVVHKIIESYDYLFKMMLPCTGDKFEDVISGLAENIFNTRTLEESVLSSASEDKTIELVSVDTNSSEILSVDFDGERIGLELDLKICPWEVVVKILKNTYLFPLDSDTAYYIPVQSVSEDGELVKGMFVFSEVNLFVSEYWLDKPYYGSSRPKSKLIYML